MALARLLDEDPDLHDCIPDSERPRAIAEAVARVETLDQGLWDEPDSPENHRDGYGLLVLEGMLARRVTLGRFDCTELLGQGDLLRPWSFEGASLASVPSRVTWNVVEPVRLASLDRRLAPSGPPWPEVAPSPMDRIFPRSRRVALPPAVCPLVPLHTR